VECRVIGRMGEYLRITPESFSDYLYIYSETDIVAAHVPGAQGEMRMESIQIFMSKNKPVEIDEFMYIKSNGMFTRNT
jgi:hypothetical protein